LGVSHASALCANASRGLSVIAEFLVFYTVQIHAPVILLNACKATAAQWLCCIVVVVVVVVDDDDDWWWMINDKLSVTGDMSMTARSVCLKWLVWFVDDLLRWDWSNRWDRCYGS